MIHLIRKIIEPFLRKNNKILNFVLIIRYYLGVPLYFFSMLSNREYIGGYLFSDQEAGRNRQKIIKSILEKINKKRIKVLEIGVYCGQTTLTICKELKKNKIEFDMICLDLWSSFENTQDKNSFIHNKMIEDLDSAKVFNLFKHNLKANNLLENCKIIKENSNKYLKNLNDSFDLIIIDGSHLYNEVNEDIKNSCRLINNNGYIIGDDYESKFSELDNIDLKKLCDKRLDIFYNKKIKKSFHPGVTLSVYENFGDINSRNGLFCIKKVEGKFIDNF